MATFLENRLARLEQAMLPPPEPRVIRRAFYRPGPHGPEWIGTYERTPSGLVLVDGDPVEYRPAVRWQAPAVPEQAEEPPPPIDQSPCTTPRDPFESSLTEAVAKIGAGYRRSQRSINRP